MRQDTVLKHLALRLLRTFQRLFHRNILELLKPVLLSLQTLQVFLHDHEVRQSVTLSLHVKRVIYFLYKQYINTQALSKRFLYMIVKGEHYNGNYNRRSSSY